MKRQWKKTHIFLITISILAIVYWFLLTMRYGTLTFLPLFLYGGVFLLIMVLLLHFFQITISDYMPKLCLRSIQCLFVICAMIFTVVEGTIIYSGYHEDNTQGDTIVVLGAGLINGDRLSLCLLYRLQRAYEEYQQNPNTTIVVTGGQGKDETISEAAAMKEWLLKQGVKEAHILVEDQSRNTNENFQFTKDIMEKHGITSSSISLITNRFHMKRAAYLGELNGFIIHPKPAKDLEYAQLCYYTREFFGLIRAYLLHY